MKCFYVLTMTKIVTLRQTLTVIRIDPNTGLPGPRWRVRVVGSPFALSHLNEHADGGGVVSDEARQRGYVVEVCILLRIVNPKKSIV